MSKKIVLDASALLAFLQQEKGSEKVEEHLSKSIMSTVNVSETIAVLSQIGIHSEEAVNIITNLIKEIIPFDTHQAHLAANLRKHTKHLGLSLGDRACLALAESLNCKVLTADKIWNKLNLDSIAIAFVRS